MKIRKGWRVKIPDIGPTATCTKSGRKEIEIELEGERMMIPVRLCEIIERNKLEP